MGYSVIKRTFEKGKWIFASDEFLSKFEPISAISGAKWIWPQEYSRAYIKKEITLSACESVFAEFACDNPFDFFVNGSLVSAENTAFSLDVTEFFNVGKNTIIIRAKQRRTDDYFSSAICGKITAGEQTFITDEGWNAFFVNRQGENEEPENWLNASFPRAPLCVSNIHPLAKKRSLYLRKSFLPKEKPLSATLYLACAGDAIVYLNSKKVCDNLFLQGNATKYKEYVALDVTPFILQGENVLSVLTGNSFLNSDANAFVFMNKNMLLAELILTFGDGSETVVPTDSSWRILPSPIVDNDLQFGIRFDSRAEIFGWNAVGFDDSLWGFASSGEHDLEVRPFVEKAYPSAKIKNTLAEGACTRYHGGFLLDFCSVLSGRCFFRFKNTRAGQKIKITYFERLTKDNEPNLLPYTSPRFSLDEVTSRSTDVFICSGKDEEVFEPSFAVCSFRYALILGVSSRSDFDVLACQIYNDISLSGCLESAFMPINQIFASAKASLLANTLNGITTSSAHSRALSAGQAWCVADAACFVGDYSSLLASYTCAGKKTFASQSGWGDEIYMLPWTLYCFYRDKALLKDRYDEILSYAFSFSSAKSFASEAVSSPFNDLLQPYATNLDKGFFAHCFYCNMLLTVQKIAETLEDYKTADKLKSMAALSIKEFNESYYLEDEDDYLPHSQAGIILPLAFNLAPRFCDKALAARLNDYVLSQGYLECGVISSKYALGVLCDYGYEATAYKMLLRESFPSYRNLATLGALGEAWDTASDNSLSVASPTFTPVLAWMFEYLGGIRPYASTPGFRHVVLQPTFIRQIGSFSCEYKSLSGVIKSSWEFKENTVTYCFEAEQNVTLILPDASSRSYPAGAHKIKIKF